jgi:hypothetical protein
MASVSMSVVHGDGVAAIFWTDAWSQVGALNLFAPNLFNATSCAGRRRSLKDALHLNQWARDITGALTTQVLCQYIKVWEITRPIVLDPLRSDRFVWKWSADGHYSASSGSSMAPRRCLGRGSCGARERHRRSSSLGGSPCTSDYGRRRAENAMDYRRMMTVRCAGSRPRRLITCF